MSVEDKENGTGEGKLEWVVENEEEEKTNDTEDWRKLADGNERWEEKTKKVEEEE
jgi:hypothetical protein